MRFKDVLLFEPGRDGGPKSKVMGFWFIRIKSAFTVALLRFDEGSREAYHSHAFDAWSLVLNGGLLEHHVDGRVQTHEPGLRIIRTRRDTFHKVYGLADSTWVLTFRGPWADTWKEITEDGSKITLTHDRVVVA